jgi:hypothetical protein
LRGLGLTLAAHVVKVKLDLEMHHSLHGADYRKVDDQRWFTRYYIRNRDRVSTEKPPPSMIVSKALPAGDDF